MNKLGDSLFCTGSNEELVKTLVRNLVEFVVVGGLAVAWYCASRVVDDMDLLMNPTPGNSKLISQALRELDLNGFDDNSFTRLGIHARLKQHHYADLLTPRADGPTYVEVAADAVDAKLFNIRVRVASVHSLIRLKEHALASLDVDIEKHLKDIELLRQYRI